MKCKYCGDQDIVNIQGKCSDMFTAQKYLRGEGHEGYVDSEFVGLNIGDGDYIDIDICLNCRRVQP
jgi:hypothetical protein